MVLAGGGGGGGRVARLRNPPQHHNIGSDRPLACILTVRYRLCYPVGYVLGSCSLAKWQHKNGQ